MKLGVITEEIRRFIFQIIILLITMLITIIGWFLVQLYIEYKTLRQDVNSMLLIQVDYNSRINHNADDIDVNAKNIEKLQDVDVQDKKNIADFYKKYGYLFTESTKRKLDK